MELRRLDTGVSGKGSGSPEDWDWEEVQRICLGFAYRYAGNRGEAEDIAQEAVLRAWQARDSLRDPSRRTPWLGTIVRNEAFRDFRKPRPSPIDLLEQIEGADDAQITGTAERADVHAALLRLTDRERQLIRMRYEEDLTQPVIAQRLGIPEGTVKVRLHRVRAKLREEIGSL